MCRGDAPQVTSGATIIAKERVHPVFLLDGAHLLHQDTLNHLHILEAGDAGAGGSSQSGC